MPTKLTSLEDIDRLVKAVYNGKGKYASLRAEDEPYLRQYLKWIQYKHPEVTLEAALEHFQLWSDFIPGWFQQ